MNKEIGKDYHVDQFEVGDMVKFTSELNRGVVTHSENGVTKVLWNGDQLTEFNWSDLNRCEFLGRLSFGPVETQNVNRQIFRCLRVFQEIVEEVNKGHKSYKVIELDNNLTELGQLIEAVKTE